MKMRRESRETIMLMRKAMGLSGTWNKISRKAETVKKKREKAEL